ncbi:MAG: signal peptide peptidase SppA, partial [Deltaproteobacteria bacterium]|nr:signal peptide peptidase SppA [Deltaproteobacteria bacterium]
KVSVAVAVPIASWVRLFRPSAKGTIQALQGLSLGLSYSRLISSGNFHAHGTQQFDVALSYWPIRYLAMGIVGRAVNLPRTGRVAGEDPDTISGPVLQSAVVDPEIAIRPLGTPVFDLAVGMRISPALSGEPRFRTNAVDPRARITTSLGGLRLFAEAEMLRFNPVVAEDFEANARLGARFQLGVEFQFSRVGLAVAPLGSANTRTPFGADGAAVRLRISQEMYPTLAARPRVVTKLALSNYRGDRGMWSVVERLDGVAKRRGLALVETRGMSMSFGQLEEIREAMLRVRNRGGKVAVYLAGAGLRSYFLASAADRIIAHPTKGLEILGIRVQTLYYRELLDRLGAKPEFVRVAEYKAWPERMHLDGASQPVKRQRHQLSADIWNHVLRMIARERGQDPRVVKEWIDDAPLTSAEAQRRGLVNDLAHPDELDATLEKWLDRRIRIEEPATPRQHASDYGPPPRIAVLMIEGDLVSGDSFTIPIIGRQVAGDRTLVREIKLLRDDPSVRAVVVRINSHGGSVDTAEAIARELDLVRRDKPVIISMGNACASGGYYIATAGQYIFSDATTQTGSIGVFYPKVDISGTLDLLGISVEEDEFGRRAGMRSLLRSYTDDELLAAQHDVDETYAHFVSRVAKARSMTLEQVDRVARGRVWAGVRAIDVGLVDDYGGLREAVARARAIAGLRVGEGAVRIVPEPQGGIENLRALFGFNIPFVQGRGSGRSFGGAVPAAMALRSVLPAGMVSALRHLPVALWWGTQPSMMALGEQTFVVED